MRYRTVFLTALLTVIQVACGQQKSAETQIAEAIAALPPEMRDAAGVLGYRGLSGTLTTLRTGNNGMICLADDPSDERFHVACYHESLDAFMARGRELRVEGKAQDEILKARQEEIESGALQFPDHPAALYSVSDGSLNPETGEIDGGRSLQVLYVPYATPESTGLTTTPGGGAWLMYPGLPWAHVMISR